MTQFLKLMGQILGYLYSWLADSRIASLFGVNLFWILFAFFCTWTVLNIFVFRARINPGDVSLGSATRANDYGDWNNHEWQPPLGLESPHDGYLE